ncbi:MAG: alpha/beta hydrolase [Proteobacteria bacterium]|nr:alpha/beta hydrolase [Pseudomonadota bacterium]
MFLTGFRSDRTGTKAMALEAFCRARGQAFLRFDYRGHGESSGAFTDGSIGAWAEDALLALDSLTQGPQVLVGSSMGGWIMLLVALARKERIAGLVGIAPAPDFTEDLLWRTFAGDERRKLGEEGVVYVPSDYEDGPYPITLKLIEEGRNHLLLRAPIAIDCPVRILQGMKDEAVPWPRALTLAERLTAADVEVTLVKAGEHRLSTDADLTRLCATLARLLDRLEGGA